MAGSVGTTTPAAWEPLIDVTPPEVAVRMALDNTATGAAFARRMVRGEPDFLVTGRCDASAESLTIIDFTALGVTFPAGTQRTLEVELFISGATVATESGYIHKREMIVGGTTPTLGIVIGAIDTNMAGAVGGFTTTDPTLTFTMATANVTLVLVNEGAAEINNFVLKAYVGKLQPIPLGI
jgi:hypothetical protein